MLRAKVYIGFNIKKMQKRVSLSKYEYGIFDMNTPLKITKQNIENYTVHKKNDKIGLLLNNTNLLDVKNTKAVFDNRHALSVICYDNVIVRLNKPEMLSYPSWLSSLERYVIPLNPSMIMIPLNPSYSVESFNQCNILIQELNAILLPYVMSTEIILCQKNEPLSSLSYIIQNVGYPSKISLLLNLDSIEKDFYTLKDIKEDIIKYDMQNSISVVETNKHTSNEREFLEFLKILKNDVIVFGEKI